MDSFKYHHIACVDHRIIDPISLEKVDEMLAVLKLPSPARALDIGCGKGEVLVRLAERGQVHGVGVEISPRFAAEAKDNVQRRVRPPSRVDIVVMDGAKYEDQQPFDVAMCVGASWIFGGHRGTLRKLSGFVHPGGLVLVGEPYWLKKPDPEYLAAASVKAEDFATHEGNVRIGIEESLVPLYSIAGSQDDWDRYEWLRVQGMERYCHLHPNDPDAPEMLDRARLTRDAYIRWGRDTIGWALYLFLRP